MIDHPAFEQLGIALLLGLLVGLQRERTEDPLAGLRTFPLITILGTILALIDSNLGGSGPDGTPAGGGGWVVAAGLVGLMGVLAVGNLLRAKQAETHPGITTEIAALLMFAVGAYLVKGDRLVAIAVGGCVAVLLQFKPELHALVAKLKDRDVRAIMQFVLIAFIILPVVPNQTYGPLDVLNPFDIWRMVVLIVGISLGGYILYKFLGRTAGILLSGILGGAVSSTATTASYSRRATEDLDSVSVAALVIAIASAVMYVRVLVLASIVAPELFAAAVWPLGVVLAAGVSAAAIGWLKTPAQQEEMPEISNPSELRVAIVIALLYGLVLLGLAAAKQWLGSQGMYLVAGLSGLTDVDAITLSTARLVNVGPEAGGLEASLGWRLILVATLTNFLFKAGLVAVLGSRRLLARTAALFALPVVAGIVVLLAW